MSRAIETITLAISVILTLIIISTTIATTTGAKALLEASSPGLQIDKEKSKGIYSAYDDTEIVGEGVLDCIKAYTDKAVVYTGKSEEKAKAANVDLPALISQELGNNLITDEFHIDNEKALTAKVEDYDYVNPTAMFYSMLYYDDDDNLIYIIFYQIDGSGKDKHPNIKPIKNNNVPDTPDTEYPDNPMLEITAEHPFMYVEKGTVISNNATSSGLTWYKLGLRVYVHYRDGSRVEIPAGDYDLTGYNKDMISSALEEQQQLTITYKGLSTFAYVTVCKPLAVTLGQEGSNYIAGHPVTINSNFPDVNYKFKADKGDVLDDAKKRNILTKILQTPNVDAHGYNIDDVEDPSDWVTEHSGIKGGYNGLSNAKTDTKIFTNDKNEANHIHITITRKITCNNLVTVDDVVELDVNFQEFTAFYINETARKDSSHGKEYERPKEDCIFYNTQYAEDGYPLVLSRLAKDDKFWIKTNSDANLKEKCANEKGKITEVDKKGNTLQATKYKAVKVGAINFDVRDNVSNYQAIWPSGDSSEVPGAKPDFIYVSLYFDLTNDNITDYYSYGNSRQSFKNNFTAKNGGATYEYRNPLYMTFSQNDKVQFLSSDVNLGNNKGDHKNDWRITNQPDRTPAEHNTGKYYKTWNGVNHYTFRMKPIYDTNVVATFPNFGGRQRSADADKDAYNPDALPLHVYWPLEGELVEILPKGYLGSRTTGSLKGGDIVQRVQAPTQVSGRPIRFTVNYKNVKFAYGDFRIDGSNMPGDSSDIPKVDQLASTANISGGVRYCKGNYNGARSYFTYNGNETRTVIYTCYKVSTNERLIVGCLFQKLYIVLLNHYDRDISYGEPETGAYRTTIYQNDLEALDTNDVNHELVDGLTGEPKDGAKPVDDSTNAVAYGDYLEPVLYSDSGPAGEICNVTFPNFTARDGTIINVQQDPVHSNYFKVGQRKYNCANAENLKFYGRDTFNLVLDGTHFSGVKVESASFTTYRFDYGVMQMWDNYRPTASPYYTVNKNDQYQLWTIYDAIVRTDSSNMHSIQSGYQFGNLLPANIKADVVSDNYFQSWSYMQPGGSVANLPSGAEYAMGDTFAMYQYPKFGGRIKKFYVRVYQLGDYKLEIDNFEGNPYSFCINDFKDQLQQPLETMNAYLFTDYYEKNAFDTKVNINNLVSADTGTVASYFGWTDEEYGYKRQIWSNSGTTSKDPAYWAHAFARVCENYKIMTGRDNPSHCNDVNHPYALGTNYELHTALGGASSENGWDVDLVANGKQTFGHVADAYGKGMLRAPCPYDPLSELRFIVNNKEDKMGWFGSYDETITKFKAFWDMNGMLDLDGSVYKRSMTAWQADYFFGACAVNADLVDVVDDALMIAPNGSNTITITCQDTSSKQPVETKHITSQYLHTAPVTSIRTLPRRCFNAYRSHVEVNDFIDEYYNSIFMGKTKDISVIQDFNGVNFRGEFNKNVGFGTYYEYRAHANWADKGFKPSDVQYCEKVIHGTRRMADTVSMCLLSRSPASSDEELATEARPANDIFSCLPWDDDGYVSDGMQGPCYDVKPFINYCNLFIASNDFDAYNAGSYIPYQTNIPDRHGNIYHNVGSGQINYITNQQTYCNDILKWYHDNCPQNDDHYAWYNNNGAYQEQGYYTFTTGPMGVNVTGDYGKPEIRADNHFAVSSGNLHDQTISGSVYNNYVYFCSTRCYQVCRVAFSFDRKNWSNYTETFDANGNKVAEGADPLDFTTWNNAVGQSKEKKGSAAVEPDGRIVRSSLWEGNKLRYVDLVSRVKGQVTAADISTWVNGASPYNGIDHVPSGFFKAQNFFGPGQSTRNPKDGLNTQSAMFRLDLGNVLKDHNRVYLRITIEYEDYGDQIITWPICIVKNQY